MEPRVILGEDWHAVMFQAPGESQQVRICLCQSEAEASLLLGGFSKLDLTAEEATALAKGLRNSLAAATQQM